MACYNRVIDVQPQCWENKSFPALRYINGVNDMNGKNKDNNQSDTLSEVERDYLDSIKLLEQKTNKK